jgi:Sec-independent protein translocase protein TatA
MNQINPFYLIFLSIVIVIFLLFKTSNLQSSVDDAKKSLQETKTIALELKQYKNSFAKTKENFKREIANKYWIKQNNIKLIYKKDGVNIVANKLNLEILNKVISRIFNGVYKIKSFNIETKDNKIASLEMSLQW